MATKRTAAARELVAKVLTGQREILAACEGRDDPFSRLLAGASIVMHVLIGFKDGISVDDLIACLCDRHVREYYRERYPPMAKWIPK